MGLFTKTKITTDKEKIKEILERGVEEIFIKDHLEKNLLSGKTLRIKFGIDPTGPKIHLGRAVPLRKLRAFQDLGHQIILIVGDFTARIGDPSDKTEKRPVLSKEKIEENMRNYKKSLAKIIDIKKTKVVYNSKWLSKLSFEKTVELAESFSVKQMENRRNFKERLERGDEVSLREFLYPLMQGYDSVVVRSDLEIGGFDQLFNLKAGRIIQKHYDMPEQDILTTVMLEGTDGRKMSTSWGNVINITDSPEDMFGKIMSIKDELIGKYFLLCTDVSEEEIKKTEEKMKGGEMNPKDAKMKLALEIVSVYHGFPAAQKAKDSFVKTFEKGEIPLDAIVVTGVAGTTAAIMKSGLVKSKTELNRLYSSNAITDMETGETISKDTEIKRDKSLRIGKKRFLKVKLNK